MVAPRTAQLKEGRRPHAKVTLPVRAALPGATSGGATLLSSGSGGFASRPPATIFYPIRDGSKYPANPVAASAFFSMTLVSFLRFAGRICANEYIKNEQQFIILEHEFIILEQQFIFPEQRLVNLEQLFIFSEQQYINLEQQFTFYEQLFILLEQQFIRNEHE